MILQNIKLRASTSYQDFLVDEIQGFVAWQHQHEDRVTRSAASE
jgi:hypothetical protein